MTKKLSLLILIALTVFLAAACDSNSTETLERKMFKVRIENIAKEYKFADSGVFNTPVNASSPAPLTPGGVYEFTVKAFPGSKLSFAAMFVHSNDLFYAPDGNGISLYDNNGMPVSGDITSRIKLWDSGTEINQEPGLGADQAPRQSGANTGAADPNANVRLAEDEFSNLPSVNEVLKVTVEPTSVNRFKVKIENVSSEHSIHTSDGNVLAALIAPGVWVVHTANNPLFEENKPDFGEGLEALAEDGNPAVLYENLKEETGITHLFAPGVFVVHTASAPVFRAGQPDRGEGLEALAEDGDPSMLAANLNGKDGISLVGVFNMPVGSSAPAPIAPGGVYEFEFDATEKDYLTFASMLVQSNDLFIAPSDAGIKLFESSDPKSGDITELIMLWDAGTEVNEEPGFGINQAPRQSAANTGAAENGAVRIVNDGYVYPNLSDIVRVTIESN
jgi:hypothetical protein